MDLSTINRENPEYRKASAQSNEINLPTNEGMDFLPNVGDENQKDKSYILALKSKKMVNDSESQKKLKNSKCLQRILEHKNEQ